MTGVVRAERDEEVRVAYLARSLAKGIKSGRRELWAP